MASLDLGTLTDRLSDDEAQMVLDRLREHLGESDFELPEGDVTAAGTAQEDLDDDVLEEFLDRLESADLGCSLYVPVELEGKLEFSDFTVGSLPSLMEVLEEMMDDLGIEDPDEDEDLSDEDFENEMEVLQARLRTVWRAFFDAGGEAMDAKLNLIVVR